jgi:hypothetical protein
VNRQHFGAFVWLRWRLFVNQMKRAGTTSAVILGLLLAGGVLLAGGLFVSGFLAGLLALGEASPATLLLVWDAVTLAFLFFWGIGVINELQRSEVLSLDRFLHLPVSLSSAFLINYLSSLFSLILLIFAPGLLGLALGLAFSRGPWMLLVLPLLAAFLLMVTALTHQFRGWLASLMVNKRRRRTIIFLLTAFFLLLSQSANLINLFAPWGGLRDERLTRMQEEQNKQLRALTGRRVTAAEVAEFQKRIDEARRAYDQEVAREQAEGWQRFERIGGLLNLVLPPGWLPLGAAAAAQGNPLPALLGFLGMALIGTASLWRAYHTTLRIYRGEFTAGKKKARPAAPAQGGGAASHTAPAPPPGAPARLMEGRLPWVSEQAAAIALLTFRSCTRAPEARMLLLTPVLLAVAFAAMFLRQGIDVSDLARPLFAFGATALILLSMVQLVGNQFGFDRSGFRVFVLCAAPRRDVLMGKNLGCAPLGLGMSAVVVVLMQVLRPMRLDHFAAAVPQMVAMYLVFCLLANLLSILAPVPVAAGALRASSIKGVALVLHIASAFVFPLALAPMLVPLGVEALLDWLGWLSGWPVCLLLSLVECAVVVLLYRVAITWEGMLLQARELKVLEAVTARAEG